MLRPRNAYRLRRAAAFIARCIRQHPDAVAFPVLATSDPDGRRRRRAEVIVFPINLARAPIAPHRGIAA